MDSDFSIPHRAKHSHHCHSDWTQGFCVWNAADIYIDSGSDNGCNMYKKSTNKEG